MLFPKGQALYENLNTSFAQLDAMVDDLKSNQFTGYAQLSAWEYEGILLLDTGNVVNAIEESKNQRRHGPTAAEGIAAKGREKDGAVSVYRLSAEMTQLLANLFNSEPVYKDLSSDLTSLDKLIAKLESEKHTGYIEIRMLKSQNAAAIFLREGQILDSVLSAKGSAVSGRKVLDQIIESAASENSLFTVYRADLAKLYGDGIDLADSFARPGTLSLWQAALKTIESTTDGMTRPGVFVVAFKRACIAQANAYPFLDPFAAEFEYRDGQIKFDGHATIAQFNEGLSRCLAQTVRDLTAQPATKDLVKKSKPATAALKDKFNSRLEEAGLTAALPELFGA